VKRELFEMRKVDFAAIYGVQIRALRSRQRPLHGWMWNMETISERPVAPSPIVGDQPAEDVDIGILDHERMVSRINT